MDYYIQNREKISFDNHRQNWPKNCLEGPTEWHECSTTSDCLQINNTNFHESMDYFANQQNLTAGKDGYYPQWNFDPIINLFCESKSIMLTNESDIAHYGEEDDYTRDFFYDYLTGEKLPLWAESVPDKVCFVPFDLYRLFTEQAPVQMVQFLACSEDYQCQTGHCNTEKGICLKPAFSTCAADDECLSKSCIAVEIKEEHTVQSMDDKIETKKCE